jgi:hypothetical protein
VTASPLIAFALAVGGTDMPVLACLCLGFALLWQRPRPVLAGLALGAAAAMKATAWPALVVAAVLLVARDGRRSAASMGATALVIVAAVVGPVAALGPRSLVQNTIAFPLGLTHVKSDAVSPLPGRLLAETGPTGHLIAVALLALAGLAVVASLAIRPPRSVPAATWRLIIALTAMFVLAPATRFGYFVYPVGLFAWLEVSRMGQQAARATGPRRGQIRELRPPGGVPVAEPGLGVGQRDDVLDCLGVVGALPGGSEVAQRLHVARPVGQLDQDGVARGAAQALQVGLLGGRLVLAGGGRGDGHPADQFGHPRAEPGRDLRHRAGGVLHHVVQDRRAQHAGIGHPGAAGQHLQGLQ